LGPGMTFRRTCDRCGATFFSPEKRASTCPKCVKRYGLKRPQAGASVKSADNRPDGRKREPAVPTPSRPEPRRQPRTTVITDELRAAIIAAYEQYSADPNARLAAIHSRIASELHVARRAVAETIACHISPKQAITPELRQQIVALYEGYVQRGERPPGGRRRAIASALGLSFAQVAGMLREWRSRIPDVRTLSREELFAIEKAYWRHLEAKDVPLSEMAAAIASELGYTEWQVARRIDMLHEDRSMVASAKDPGPEARAKLEAAYREYLASDSPPPDSLHSTLAKRFGLTSRQVYLVLLDYRNRQRADASAA